MQSPPKSSIGVFATKRSAFRSQKPGPSEGFSVNRAEIQPTSTPDFLFSPTSQITGRLAAICLKVNEGFLFCCFFLAKNVSPVPPPSYYQENGEWKPRPADAAGAHFVPAMPAAVSHSTEFETVPAPSILPVLIEEECEDDDDGDKSAHHSI